MIERENLEGQIVELDAAIKERGAKEFELNMRKNKRQARAGYYLAAVVVGLLFLATQVSNSAIEGFFCGFGVMFAAFAYEFSTNEIKHETDKQRSGRESLEHLREILRLKLAHLEERAND